MLREFRQINPELPADNRTLLGTPRTTVTKNICGGIYIHFGLTTGIHLQFHQCGVSSSTEVQLQLHIDGMTVFKSSSLQLWPILCRVVNWNSSIFVVGIFVVDKSQLKSMNILMT